MLNVVLTGGPSSGKTTVLNRIKEENKLFMNKLINI